jgi:asparagine synthase (glutamine-hydrolysing)
MCGIFGTLKRGNELPAPALIASALAVQRHRGPDGERVQSFTFAHSTLTLAHQRLAIIDLSHAADQPMVYRDGEGVIAYNGELYNYIELRQELVQSGERFSTQSDTEVLLSALHTWGIERTLSLCNWMGAFAWLDRRRERLVLACDAGSEKPLYYYVDETQLIFASEIKTVLTLLQRRLPLDRDVVGQFIFQGLTDASPQTFFRGITRLEPGTFVSLDVSARRYALAPVRYPTPACAPELSRLPLPDFVAALRELFLDAVRLRLRSDVPVGVLLSGGVDSSSIVAAARAVSSQTPQLLSAVSDDPRFDESPYIALMERHLGQAAHKVTLRITPGTQLEEVSQANWCNDAPVTSMSALGHSRLMQRAKELGLTVILSGQGADEILLGYRKFLGFYLQSLLRQRRFATAAAVLGGFFLNRAIVTQFDLSNAKRYVGALRALDRSADASIAGESLSGWRALPLDLGGGSLADRQMLDVRRYSVPSLCHYEDRMSMQWSREIRLPFLDPRLVDLLIRAPDDYKIRRGWTKYALRCAMAPLLPPAICWRRDKQGFSNPQGEWLKKELRAAVRETFCPQSLMALKGFVNSPQLLSMYERYCRQPANGGRIWYREIFAPLSLELWMRRYEPWIA